MANVSSHFVWQVASGKWQMTNGKWQVASGKWQCASVSSWFIWQVASGKWQIANDKWQVASGKWQIANYKWQVASGKWQMANVSSRRAPPLSLRGEVILQPRGPHTSMQWLSNARKFAHVSFGVSVSICKPSVSSKCKYVNECNDTYTCTLLDMCAHNLTSIYFYVVSIPVNVKAPTTNNSHAIPPPPRVTGLPHFRAAWKL